MQVVLSPNQVPVRLTEERWAHIVSQHPEMLTQRERVIETVGQPDLIQIGDYGELLAVRFYSKTPLTRKHLVVAFKETSEDDGFIPTAYFARRPSARRSVLWSR